MKKRISMMLLMLLTMVFSVPSYGINSVELPYVQSRLPQIVADLRVDDVNGRPLTTQPIPDENTLTATLNQEQLRVISATPLSDASVSARWYFLVDVSTSVSQRQLDDVVKQLVQLKADMQPQEQMVVLTFGTQLDAVLEGNETSEQVQEKLGSIQRLAGGTRIYDALHRTMALVSSESQAAWQRNIVVVISDGVEYAMSDVAVTAEEMETSILESGINLYTLGIQGTAGRSLERLSAWSRKTGGTTVLLDAGGSDTELTQIRKHFQSGYRVSLQAKTNIPPAAEGTLQLSLQTEDTALAISKVLDVSIHQPDVNTPYILSINSPEANTVEVVFSEAVSGGDNLQNYALTQEDGAVVPLVDLQYHGENNTARLTTEQPLYDGSYSLQTANVFDISVEQNGLQEGKTALEVVQRPTPGPSPSERTLWGIVFCVGVLAVVVATVLIIRQLRQSAAGVQSQMQTQTVQPSWDTGSTYTPQNQTWTPLPIHTPAVEKKVTLTIVLPHAAPYTADITVGEAFIIGRSSGCNLKLEDASSSRRHCTLSYGEGCLWAEDLQSTQGTYLNGVKMKGRNPLNEGDTLFLGKTKISVHMV